MTSTLSRAIRRQSDKAFKVAKKLIVCGNDLALKYTAAAVAGDEQARVKLEAALADQKAALEIEDAAVRATGYLLFEPHVRLSVETGIQSLQEFLQMSRPDAHAAAVHAERVKRGLADP